MLQSRPRTASITPGDGRIGTSTPAMRATCSDHGSGGVDHEVGADRGLASGDEVAHPGAGHHAAGALEIRDVDVVQQHRAVGLGGGEEPQRHPHGVHRGVGHPHRELQLGVEHRLEPQRLVGLQHLRCGCRSPRSPPGTPGR